MTRLHAMHGVNHLKEKHEAIFGTKLPEGGKRLKSCA